MKTHRDRAGILLADFLATTVLEEQLMGFRFRRSMSIARGVRLNVTKNGLNSVSLGKPGASLNMGRGGTRTTFGLPGSGMSYSTRTGSGSSLGSGLAVATLFVLIFAAIRGNLPARIVLSALGVGFLVLWVSEGSPQRNNNSTQASSISNTTLTGVQWPARPVSALDLTSTALLSPVPMQGATTSSAAPAASPAAPAESPSSEEVVVTTTGANVRATPSMKGKILRQLAVGTPLLVNRIERNWSYVRSEDSGESLGWVHHSILRAR